MKYLTLFLFTLTCSAQVVLQNATIQSATFSANGGGDGGGGPDVWYWAGTGKNDASFTSTTTAGWNTHTYAYGAVVTVGQAGTATKIAVKAGTESGTITVKIALYDSSNNLLASGSNATVTGAQSWREVTINQAVTATTYKVLVSCSTVDGKLSYDTGQDGIYSNDAYASFPVDPVSPSTESGQIYGVKIYVD